MVLDNGLSPRFCAPRIWGPQIFRFHVIHVLNEIVLCNTILHPCGEVLADFEKGKKLTAIKRLDRTADFRAWLGQKKTPPKRGKEVARFV